MKLNLRIGDKENNFTFRELRELKTDLLDKIYGDSGFRYRFSFEKLYENTLLRTVVKLYGDNYKLVKYAVRINGKLMENVSDFFKTNLKLIKYAIRESSKALRFVPNEILSNYEIIKYVIKNSPRQFVSVNDFVYTNTIPYYSSIERTQERKQILEQILKKASDYKSFIVPIDSRHQNILLKF